MQENAFSKQTRLIGYRGELQLTSHAENMHLRQLKA